MASKRLNVLVYNGPGATQNALRHALYTLRRLLTPNYAVLPLTTHALLNEPWQGTCALLVIPGGADQLYCNALNGTGNRRIRSYVEHGGSYIGFCAGGYYGCSKCEFEIGRKLYEIVGERELKFFPGSCRGCAFGGFKYDTENGARPSELLVEKKCFQGQVPERVRVYYNGGGLFADADAYEDQGVEVLARYSEPTAVNGGIGSKENGGAAAIVYCKVGRGNVVLTGPHPEFSGTNLEVMHAKLEQGEWPVTVESLKRDEQLRAELMKGCLTKLGLDVAEDDSAPPSLSKLYLSSQQSGGVLQLIQGLDEIIEKQDDEDYIKDENDTFILEKPSSLNMTKLVDPLSKVDGDAPSLETVEPDQISDDNNRTISLEGAREDHAKAKDQIVDFAKIIKHIIVHESDYPSAKDTPYFNHSAFFTNLMHYYSKTRESNTAIGTNLLYGECVTSTSTMLEKNTQLLRRLPHGFTFNATTQVAGRGRGNNVWVSPAGSLMFSTVIRHEVSLQPKAPVVFLQYLAAMAVVDAIRTYDKGYDVVEVRLKWPNDIYALDPKASLNAQGANRYTKIGGILVNSHYSSTMYHSIVGLGLNDKYYDSWLHTGQLVSLETEAGKRARIIGITPDWGLLVGEEVDDEGRGLGRKIELQSDSNSFDFFKGLVKRKS